MTCEGCGTEEVIEVNGYLGTLTEYWCEDCGFDGENMENTLFTIEEIRRHVSAGLPKSKFESTLNLLIISIRLYDDSDSLTKEALLKSMSAMLGYSGYSPEASS